MIKEIPSIPKLLTMVAFALGSFGALLFLWLSFGGPVPFHPKGYRVMVQFPEAGQLTEQSDVRISGVNVGKVIKVYPNPNGPTNAEIEIKPKFAPIPAASKATLRSKTLLGETFVELAPNRGKDAKPLDEKGTIPVTAVAPTVELDELLRTFDEPTREAFQVWMQEQAGALKGRGADLNAAFQEFPEFVDNFAALSATLDAQTGGVRETISSTEAFFRALSARQGDLRGLISASNRTFNVIGDRNEQLAQIFREFPAFERASTKILPKVTELADEANPTVVRMQAVATELTPAFAAIEELSPDLARFMTRLDPVITASAKGLPAFDRILEQFPPLLEDFGPFTRTINPLLHYLGEHKNDITAFFGNVTSASNSRQGLGGTRAGSAHLLRVGLSVSPQTLSVQPRAFGQNRNNPYMAPGGMNNLASGLRTLTPQTCGNGDPAPPVASTLPGLAERVQTYAFKGMGRATPRPACVAQGPRTGYNTIFPQLTADPADAEGPTR
ncbi:MAG: MCE family protein [Patulibacter sp.]|nr:MCE family protein [Patulibacter sp.]